MKLKAFLEANILKIFVGMVHSLRYLYFSNFLIITLDGFKEIMVNMFVKFNI